jgi:hypothetical protein
MLGMTVLATIAISFSLIFKAFLIALLRAIIKKSSNSSALESKESLIAIVFISLLAVRVTLICPSAAISSTKTVFNLVSLL